jgi:signal transduction histidine kinase
MRLSRFIGLCIVLVLLLLSVLTTYAISTLYHAGLDDSSQFYLWKDSQYATQHYQQTGQLPPSDDFRAYYATLQQVPRIYAQQIQPQQLTLYQPILILRPTESVYLLPFHLTTSSQFSFVLHRFTAAADEGYSESKFSSVLAWFLVLGVPCALLIAYGLFRAIASPLAQLSAWSQALAEHENPQPLPANRLGFIEFQQLAHLFYQAFCLVKASNQREKLFLQTLSHELRTPLAVTQATLDVLERKTHDAWWHEKLTRMRRANRTMQDLTETLLWLWREPDTIHSPAKHKVNVENLIDDCWHDLQSQTTEIHILHKQLSAQLQWTEPYALLHMIVSNLLKNAQHYGQSDSITVTADTQHLCVINQKKADIEQGFGIGLSLVSHITERLSWQFDIEEDEHHFRVTVRF